MRPFAALDHELAGVPGTISVWCGRPGETPSYTRAEHAPHYAASMMKVAVLVALHRRAEAGLVDLDGLVPVRNDFASADPGAPRYGCRHRYDNDDAVWAHLDGSAPVRWLAERMIVGSSNLATNVLLDLVDVPAATAVWRLVGARHSVIGRGIEDVAGAAAGITNLVTAADLAALLAAISLGARRPGPLASPAACAAMLATLCRQEVRVDLAAGLPAGTPAALKNGWVSGLRHAAAVVFPDDSPPFLLAVCATTPLATGGHNDEACQLVAKIAATAWRHRAGLARPGGPGA